MCCMKINKTPNISSCIISQVPFVHSNESCELVQHFIVKLPSVLYFLLRQCCYFSLQSLKTSILYRLSQWVMGLFLWFIHYYCFSCLLDMFQPLLFEVTFVLQGMKVRNVLNNTIVVKLSLNKKS